MLKAIEDGLNEVAPGLGAFKSDLGAVMRLQDNEEEALSLLEEALGQTW